MRKLRCRGKFSVYYHEDVETSVLIFQIESVGDPQTQGTITGSGNGASSPGLRRLWRVFARFSR
jgi:hypothetical protein